MSMLGMDPREAAFHRRVMAVRTLDEQRAADARRRPLDLHVAPELALVIPLGLMVFRLDQPAHDVIQVVALQFLLLAGWLAGWTRHVVYSRDIAVLAYQPMSDRAYFDRQALGVALRASLYFVTMAGVFCYGVALGASFSAAAQWTLTLLTAWAVTLVIAALLYAGLPFLGLRGGLAALAAATVLPIVLPVMNVLTAAWLLPTTWPWALIGSTSLPMVYPLFLLAIAATGPAYRLARRTFSVETLILSTTSDPHPGAALEAFPLAPPPPGTSLLELAPQLRDRRLRRQEMLEPTVRAMLRQAARPRPQGFIEVLLDRLHPEDTAVRDVFTCGRGDITRRFVTSSAIMLAGWGAVAILAGLGCPLEIVALMLLGLSGLASFAPLDILTPASLPGLLGTACGDLPTLAVHPIDFRTASRVVLRAARLVTLLWTPLLAFHFASLSAVLPWRFPWAIPIVLVAQVVLIPPILAVHLIARTSQYATVRGLLSAGSVVMAWIIVTWAVLAVLASQAPVSRLLLLSLLTAAAALTWYVLGRLHERGDLVLPFWQAS